MHATCAKPIPADINSGTGLFECQGLQMEDMGTAPLAAHLAAVALMNSNPRLYLGNASMRVEGYDQ